MISSNKARPMYHLPRFPKDMEYVHPLDVKPEVYTVLPVTVLPMLSFKLSLVTLKVAGASLRVQLPLDALDGLAFVMISSAASFRPLRKSTRRTTRRSASGTRVLEFVRGTSLEGFIDRSSLGDGQDSACAVAGKEEAEAGLDVGVCVSALGPNALCPQWPCKSCAANAGDREARDGRPPQAPPCPDVGQSG